MMVAIILSVYKKDKALPVYWAIQSLLNQTHRELLIFIRLDGEVDDNVGLLLAYLRKKFNKIIISENDSNRGLSYSLNQLLGIIVTQYPDIQFIARMDADDVSHSDRVRQQVNFLTTHTDIDVLGTACKEFGIYNKIIIKDQYDSTIKKHILKMTPFIHPSVMFRVNIFMDGNRYPQDTVLCEDLAFWLNLSLRNYKFHNLPEVLLFYRINNTTLSRRTGLKKAFSELKLRTTYLRTMRKHIPSNSIYILGHFAIRIMPVYIVRMIYRLLR
ncbi:glycosyltransferase [Yersinia enterocolitica]